MAPIQNPRIIFNSIPEGYPIPGETLVVDTSERIDLDTAPLSGGALLKIICISVDPYLRGRMREPHIPSYFPAFPLHKPIYNFAVARVLRSENADVKVGQHLYGWLDFTHYQIVDAEGLKKLRVLPEGTGVPWSAYVGAAGMPGQTAYYGWKVLEPKKGETIYISTAAGPVGSAVVQLAKAAGLKVIASAGQEGKLQFLRELGADVVFNYKTANVEEILKEHAPIDIYWDHVGGKTLDAVLPRMKLHGRILIVGHVSSYNSKPDPVYNLDQFLALCIRMYGFLVTDHEEQYGKEFYDVVPGKIARGELKYTETVVHSLEEAPQLILDVQQGKNAGKAVVVLEDD
ncbi:NAD(P)-binding protein [Auricularia subglabra TFB-10046 SS5]|nr:NAD(P)-binding protein [Auricularia subglabra TFB-10046 SS5]